MATAHVNVKGRTSMDGRGWAAGLRKMETGTKAAAGRMAGQVSGMIGGVFAVRSIIGATRRMIDYADTIDKTAKRLSASTETVQKFDFAATQSGANLESVQDAFMDLAKAIQEAKDGAETKRKALLDFGVTMQMLRTARPEEVFLKIAEAIEKAGGAMDKAKSLEELMGGGGRKLVPAFVSGFSGLMSQAPDPIEAETIKRLATFKDEMDRLTRTVLPAAANAVAALANAWESFFSNISFDNFQENILDIVAPKKGSKGAKNINVSQREWDVIGAEFGKPLPRPMSPEQMLKNKAANEAAAEAAEKAAADEEAAAAAAARAANTSWSKPSLQLNSLQRIGAAVSQSADPIAIEKNNNTLLKAIAKNTKKTADSTDEI